MSETESPWWVVLVVQTIAPSERFVGPFDSTEDADAWIKRNWSDAWQRVVVAPLDVRAAAHD